LIISSALYIIYFNAHKDLIRRVPICTATKTKKIAPKKDGSWKTIWAFPEIGVGPQNGWFIMENLIKMDDLGGKPTIFWKHPFFWGG